MGKVSSKLVLMYVVFILMTIAGLLSTISGTILWLTNDGGGRRGGLREGVRTNETILTRSTVFGFDRNTWRITHVYSSLVFIILVIIHALLNWRWVMNVSRIVLSSRV